MALGPRQAAFVREYLIDKNATQAAIRAGYSSNGASVQATRLLANASVRAEIDSRLNKLAQKLELTAEKVLRDIERIANTAEESADYHAALKGKELLGKHLKLFTDKVDVSGEVIVEVRKYSAEGGE